jgi:hypothetical protein
MTASRDSIQHLRVQWRGPADRARTPAAALRLERQFDAVDWRPAGIRPGQILLIRRLRGLPALKLGAGWALDWEAALREEVTRLYRNAVRPGRTIPHDAESILFDDPVELLVALTQEVVEPSTLLASNPRWYWSQVIPTPVSSAPGTRLAALWVQYAAHLPRALIALPLATVIAALNRLSAAEVQVALQAVAAAYHTLPPLLDEPAQHTDAPGSYHPSPQRIDSVPVGEPARSVSLAMGSLWWRWLPPSHRAQMPHGRLGQVFAVWCAALAHQPAMAASPAFRQAIAEWYPAPAEFAARRSAAQGSDHPTLTTNPPDSGQVALSTLAPVLLDDEAQPEPDASTHPGELTRLAGIFFLIHLLPWLEWPADDLPCNPWLLIAALGRTLLHPLSPVDERDPIWVLLSRLAEDEPPPSNLDDWILERVAAVIARLQTSLPEVEAVGDFLLRRTGRVCISRTHIDLDLPMEQADVRLRRTGLDFNPGWVPALGYIIHFHYLDEGVS